MHEIKSVKFTQSVMISGCMLAIGVGKIYFLKRLANAAIY